MEKKAVIYITRYRGYDPKKRFCVLKDKVSRTIQDAIVDVPSLLKAFDGHLDDLFDKYNNGLLFESQTGIGVFLDELNADEVKRYNDFLAKKAQREDDERKERELFEQFKKDISSGVYQRRADVSLSPSPSPSPSPSSVPDKQPSSSE